MKKNLLLAASLLLGVSAFSTVRLPNIFGSGMVLQRGKPITVWGWADKGEQVTVQFNHQSKTVTTGADGKWMVQLRAEQAGGPYTLQVNGTNSITLSDVLMGDVWICSGQSNMEFHVSGVVNAKQEIQQINNPNIRHFYLPRTVSGTPKDDVDKSAWLPANPANAGDFTAVGYFFAEALYQKLHVPIGLIHTSWGGTDVETWISPDGIAGDPQLKQAVATVKPGDVEALAKRQHEKMMQLIQQLQNGLPAPGATASWNQADFNDQSWPVMALPALWETKQLVNFDGTAWFRKTITVDAADAGKTAVLSLGTIDDIDDSYVNGVHVGSSKVYNDKRVYTIPAGVLKAGKNVIAVKVLDTGGGGGIYGDAAEMFLDVNGHKQSLTGNWSFQVEAISTISTSVGPNSMPSLLYNAMINPLLPLSVKGAIWYQGENNAGRAYQYRTSFPLMITDWRKHFKQGNFPFYFVQLASFNSAGGNANGSTWAELREAQTRTLSLPATGMAVTTDIGESKDIHPKNKQDVGKRLAAVALHNTYGLSSEYTGPVYASMKTSGSQVTLSFTHAEGMQTKTGTDVLKGFYVAGADKQFYPAAATIHGSTVVVSAANVAHPVAVRYAWADDAGEANLFNNAGFPAVPFRTDQWKGITEGKVYTLAK
ncbi:sialate O-acetylesterase [Deminuibacter soli]|uniref:Sialate O-acetylesterase domain-containing protein n=1 Tax=Deminuibacter soli TaxID=2291815 RepID=A0A3E1NF12_9BACT|nr:sialate O-acetylesterase [Deminuibacter soli]RFM26549.1 hypothetical protein DXN05_19970 [Deminuibacter soli]